MDNQGSPFLTVKTSMLIFMFAVMISAALFTTSFLPLREYKKLEAKCTSATTASVTENGAQEQEGVFYYGPSVEIYSYESSVSFRTKVVNTVNLNMSWKKNEPLAVLYNPENPTEVILRDDHTAQRHYYASLIICGVLCLISVILIIIAIARAFKKPPERVSVDSNILGQSFDEWQRSLNEQKAAAAQATVSEEVSATDEDAKPSDSGGQ